jgi:hypothetical protein
LVGLEASPEGRLILQRLCNIVEQYSKMNSESATSAAGGADKSASQENKK